MNVCQIIAVDPVKTLAPILMEVTNAAVLKSRDLNCHRIITLVRTLMSAKKIMQDVLKFA